MSKLKLNTYDIYQDIKDRTSGEIYIGVLGPVRTGKSTFIKRFMDEMVLPSMMDTNAKTRAMDELPQSAAGKTITTTEPKFVPNEAALIELDGGVNVAVRLIDCVGYMVDGASGHLEEGADRMVKTPWFEEAVPFSMAAQIGTDKVMNDHSTIGVVITTDGSFGDLPRENYIEAEDKTITALKNIHKPFLVLVNTERPLSEDAESIANSIAQKHGVKAIPMNCAQLKRADINRILENILYEFPISAVEFYMPKWVEMLPQNSKMKLDLCERVQSIMKEYDTLRDVIEHPICIESPYVKECLLKEIHADSGIVKICLETEESVYYEMLTEMVGEEIQDEYQLISLLKAYSSMRLEYSKVLEAVSMVKMKGYGVVTPVREEITLEKPEIIKNNNKYGVKIKANGPSVHMIQANIGTEIAPIVGSKEQAEDLMQYIENQEQENGIWDTNIFGKTIEQLVEDGIHSKISSIDDESQMKLQDTMQKIVNDSNGGMVCIII